MQQAFLLHRHQSFSSSSTPAQHEQASSSPKQHHNTGSSNEQQSIRQLRERLFGAPIQPRERTGRRVLARALVGAEMASWYYNPPTVPGIHNEEREQ